MCSRSVTVSILELQSLNMESHQQSLEEEEETLALWQCCHADKTPSRPSLDVLSIYHIPYSAFHSLRIVLMRGLQELWGRWRERKGEFHSLKGSLLPKICNWYVLSVLIAKGFLNEHQLLGLGLSNSSDMFLTWLVQLLIIFSWRSCRGFGFSLLLFSCLINFSMDLI